MSVQLQAACEQCGSDAGAGDLFCRSCGAKLDQSSEQAAHGVSDDPVAEDTTEARHEPLPETTEVVRPFYRRWSVVAGFLAVLALVGAVALLLASGGGEESKTPKPKPAVAARARLQEPFETLLRERDTYFTLERQFLGAMGSARGKYEAFITAEDGYEAETERITAANEPGYALCRTYYEIPCPDPYYPDSPQVPDFATEVLQLRATEADFRDLLAALNSMDVPKDLSVMHAQLVKSVETTTSEAAHDADVLSQAATSGDEGYGTVDRGALQTLRTDDALASIREMNAAAVSLAKRLKLSPDDYDIPGGRDLDPTDHSNLE